MFTIVKDAEALLKEGKKEEAARKLRAAEIRLASVASVSLRSNLRRTVEKLLAKADSRLSLRREGFRKAAQCLVKAAKAYQQKKWYRTALDLLHEARSLDPILAEKELEILKRVAPAVFTRPLTAKQETAPEKKIPELVDLMPQFRAEIDTGWEITSEMVKSPKLGEATTVVIGTTPRHGDGEVSIELLHGNKRGAAGFLFGVRGYEDYFLLEVRFYEPGLQTGAAVYQYHDAKLTRLGTALFTLTSEEKDDWIRLKVDIKDKDIVCHVGSKTTFKARCPRKPHGAVGMFISGNSLNKEPVKYRKLHIKKP